jgi:hypothetical protein
MDSISVENDIMDVESDTSHVFISHGSFFGGPLEGGFHRFSNFVQELDTFSDINQDVGSSLFRSEGPDFLGISLVPFEFFNQLFGSIFGVLFGSHGSFFDLISEFGVKGLSVNIKSVMFVGGFRHTDLVRGFCASFFIGNDGFRFDNIDIMAIFFSQIVNTDFNVEFTATSDNVFTSFFSMDQDKGIGFGEFLQTINQFREILGVFGFNGNSDDGGDRVFHGSDIVSLGVRGNGTGFEEILINTNQTNSVSARNVGDIFDGSTHHQYGSLNGFFIKIVFLTRDVVRSLDSDFHTSSDGSGENSTESEESRLISGGHHFGDVHHKGSFGVTRGNSFVKIVIFRSFIEIFGSVFLGGFRGR